MGLSPLPIDANTTHESISPNWVTTRLDFLANWGRANSLWPMPFATACCGIELMAVGCSRYDIARFGAEAMRFSPRQSDLLIVAGRVTIKMMPVLQHIYQQMTEPKWVISRKVCSPRALSSMRMFVSTPANGWSSSQVQVKASSFGARSTRT